MDELTRTEKNNMAIGFDILLQGQFELQVEAYGINPHHLEGEELADFLRWNAFALSDELHEAMAEVGWKPWASSRHLNQKAFATELVDLLHFFANLCLAAGITGEMLAQIYSEKRQRNLERQQEGYDGVKEKCLYCKRDLAEGKCRSTEEEDYCQEWDK